MSERLDQLDQLEARDLALRLRPDWTDADFDAAWARFMELKRQKELN